MDKQKSQCPRCDEDLVMYEGPKNKPSMGECSKCGDVFRKTPRGLVPMNHLMQLVDAGDDRIRSAISVTKTATLRSFLDKYSSDCMQLQIEMGRMESDLKALLCRIENRLDNALVDLGEFAFVSDTANRGLCQLREARELVSTLSRKQRGVIKSSS